MSVASLMKEDFSPGDIIFPELAISLAGFRGSVCGNQDFVCCQRVVLL